MEREQIIKALECCESHEGDNCPNCPYHYTVNGYNHNCREDMVIDALSLIKELTEEVAGWKEIAEGYQKQFEDCYEDKKRLAEENERLKGIPKQLYKEMSERMIEERKIERKLAVRKMQERLKTCFEDNTKYDGFRVSVWIDQIAKEMLGGNND